jgi:hypothetical protein
MRLVFFSFVCFLIAGVAFPALSANQQEKPVSLYALDKQYKSAIKSLSQEQRQILSNLDQENIRRSEPLTKLIENSKLFKSCGVRDRSIEYTHGDMFLNFKLHALDMVSKNQRYIYNLQKTIDFVDEKLLWGHLSFLTDVQTQRAARNAKKSHVLIAEKGGLRGEDLCKDYKLRIEKKYSNRVYDESEKDNMTGAIKACSVNYAYAASEDLMISSQLVFFKEVNRKANLDFSTKIFVNNNQTVEVELIQCSEI